MFKYLIYFLIYLCASLNKAYSEDKHSLTILAPQNMSYALTEIIREYSKTNNTPLTGSFNLISNLVDDILEGESADIIITDHSDWITSLKQKGLISVTSISNLVEDKLVLVANKDFYTLNNNVFVGLADEQDKKDFYQKFTIFIPNWTHDMAGVYTHEALKNLPYLFNSYNNIIEVEDTIEELSQINDALAIARYTESYDNVAINIIETIDTKLHQRFIYQIAAIAGENMEQAEKFITYIKSDSALNILKKYGFKILE